jgi:hypothetical protein
MEIRRRTALTLGAALASGVFLPASADAASRRPLDLRLPADNLRAWMKLHTGLDEGDLYYWYRCRQDLAAPGERIMPFVGYDTLYRFQVRPQTDGTYLVTRWETCIYTDPANDSVLDEVTNPLSGARVRPFHFKEGPVVFRYSTKRPEIVGSPVVARSDAPYVLPWVTLGDDVWVTNEAYFAFPHPLKPSAFPKSSSGEVLTFSNISTLRGSLAELEDERVRSAACRLSYNATAGWSPWMEMGQRPGFVVWRGQGAKLTDVGLLPKATREAFERIHPEIFIAEPWKGHRLMFDEYRKARSA